MIWGRGLIGQSASALGMQIGVDLASNEKLSRAYEATTAFSRFYATEALPDDARLAADAEAAVSLLGEIYRAIELGRAPSSEPPEIVEAQSLLEKVSRPGSGRANGQGFGLSAVERSLVESRAMNLAFGWLRDNDFHNVKDVHKTHSCDFVAVKNGVEYHIEVKGTTAGLGKILLTANEVALHRRCHPHNVLIVVHDVKLHELRNQAIGGTVTVFERWAIEASNLRPLSYFYQLN